MGQDGKTKVVHEGEAVVEMVGTIHHGENRGTKPVILYMFYLSQKDLPLAVQHPEIPMNKKTQYEYEKYNSMEMCCNYDNLCSLLDFVFR